MSYGFDKICGCNRFPRADSSHSRAGTLAADSMAATTNPDIHLLGMEGSTALKVSNNMVCFKHGRKKSLEKEGSDSSEED
jgi:hypothetical protein